MTARVTLASLMLLGSLGVAQARRPRNVPPELAVKDLAAARVLQLSTIPLLPSAPLYGADAVLVLPTGEVATGVADIDTLQGRHLAMMESIHFAAGPVEVHLLDASNATFSLSGSEAVQVKGMGDMTLSMQILGVATKTKDGWRIVNEMDLIPWSPAPPQSTPPMRPHPPVTTPAPTVPKPIPPPPNHPKVG